MKKFATILFAVLFLSVSALNAHAVRESRPLPTDKRFRVITYNPNDVFKYTGYYETQSSITFEAGEQIKTISMGNSTSWQVIPSGNRIFLKPVEDFATTNMTVITDKRIYQFELHAKEREGDDFQDPDLAFVTRFIYPSETSNSAVQHFAKKNVEPDMTEPEKYNFNYTISGSGVIAPLKIFDDGEFTYFKFPDVNAELPAFFLVDSDGKEGLINYRMVGDYVVLERVASQLTLRHGNDVTCVFNEAIPQIRPKPKKKFWSIF